MKRPQVRARAGAGLGRLLARPQFVRLAPLLEGALAVAAITAGVALWSVPAALVALGVLLLFDRLTD